MNVNVRVTSAKNRNQSMAQRNTLQEYNLGESNSTLFNNELISHRFDPVADRQQAAERQHAQGGEKAKVTH